MKKTTLFFIHVVFVLFASAQMKQASMPRFQRWINNEEFIINQSFPEAPVAKDYVYNVNKKTYTLSTLTKPVSKIVIVKNNDLFLKENGNETQLTFDEALEKNPTLSPDEKFVGFTRANNLFTIELSTKKEIAITNESQAGILNGYASWVYFEEIFGRPTQYRAFWWSPDSKYISFMRFDETKVPMFPIYSSDGLYGSIEETRYPKAGEANPTVKIGWTSPSGGSITWADFNEQEDQYFGWPIWNPNTHTMWMSWMDRGQNNLKIFELDMVSGKKKEVYTEYQKTWIDLEDRVGGRINFLLNNAGYIAQSDASGWNHLYLYTMDGKLRNQITTGKYTVTGIEHIDEKTRSIYFTARGLESSARVDLYVVNFDGTNLKRLTVGAYHNAQIHLSPDQKFIVTVYSNVNTPTAIGLIDATAKSKTIQPLGISPDAQLNTAELPITTMMTIKSADGLFDLPALVTWPKNWDSTKKYPLLVSIYGGPNAGTVMDSWSYSAAKVQWANEGIIQVAFDHRASGHFGKYGVNFMYRNLGYWEMQDYMTMAKWFIDKGYANPSKIAMTGWSYGGYMSCMAVTYGAAVFTHAMAGGSVTSWELYDSHYTERFMDTPKENPAGYKSGSVLTHLKQYKGVLQLVHGTTDDNVHLQNSLQLAKALQDAGKPFEMMFYPGSRHGLSPSQGKHYNELKTNFIYEQLLDKAAPSKK